MKKSLIAPLAGLACAAVVGTFALVGAGKFVNVQVNANPVEYSVTFDGSESTTVEDPYNNGDYAICTTTDNGNKVGVVGYDNTYSDRLSFRGNNFYELQLTDLSLTLKNAGAREFSHITGFQATFTGKLKLCYEVWEDEFDFDKVEQNVESGVKYDVSLAPSCNPRFERGDGGNVTISSLTIYYSC